MGIMLRMHTLPAGFIAPCLPTKTDRLLSGSHRWSATVQVKSSIIMRQ